VMSCRSGQTVLARYVLLGDHPKANHVHLRDRSGSNANELIPSKSGLLYFADRPRARPRTLRSWAITYNATSPAHAITSSVMAARISRSQMKHADALTLQARHCSPFVVVAMQGLCGRYLVDSRVMRAYGQNRGASDGGK